MMLRSQLLEFVIPALSGRTATLERVPPDSDDDGNDDDDSDDDDDDSDDSDGPKYCKLHGKCSHTTDQCKDIKQMVKAEKERRKKNKFKRSKYNKKFDSKSFARRISRR